MCLVGYKDREIDPCCTYSGDAEARDKMGYGEGGE